MTFIKLVRHMSGLSTSKPAVMFDSVMKRLKKSVQTSLIFKRAKSRLLSGSSLVEFAG